MARIPKEGDNAAIAVRLLPRGLRIIDGDDTYYVLSHVVLEGHRFANRVITKGESLTSWGLPFGFALRYVMLK